MGDVRRTILETSEAVLLGAAVCVLMALSGWPDTVSAQNSAAASTVAGQAIDAETGEPVAFVQVLLEEIRRTSQTDEKGHFEILNVRAGNYMLQTFRIGYEPIVRTINVPRGDTLQLVLRLSATPLSAGEVVIEGTRAEADPLGERDVTLSDRRLRRQLGVTVAETLEEEPGLSMRSMGPAPARPVLRGLGGERLLVLEDGGRTGDLSHTSSDHAVAIEPITAERIEVVRGPATLIYGPNTLGGVVNVERDAVPRNLPGRVQGRLSSQFESVRRGAAGGLDVAGSLGDVALRTEGSYRTTLDTHTPEGVLENTGIETSSGAVGASYVRPWGFAGASGGIYRSDYGIPGGFVGAHPDGVNIRLRRRHVNFATDYAPPGTALVERLEARADYTWYFHQEFEDVEETVLGAEYGVLSYHGDLRARTRTTWGSGAVGVWGEYRDYAAGGRTNTPASTEWTLAGYAFHDARLGRLTVAGGLRYDLREVTPAEEEDSRIGRIRSRSFGGLSASIEARAPVGDGFVVGTRAMRSIRMPGIEELYSEGPHLAAYTYQIGDPDLELERGLGGEIFLRRTGERLQGTVAAYANWYEAYLFPRNTGILNPRRLLPEYQFSAAQARLVGAEAQVEWHLSDDLALDGALSYTRGTLTDRDVPLPQMPPLQSHLEARYTLGGIEWTMRVRGAAAQDRVYAFDSGRSTDADVISEEPTDGYAVLGASAQYQRATGRLLHTFTLGLDNALDTTYRDHLSRVREIMPEPGRNVRLLYRVYF